MYASCAGSVRLWKSTDSSTTLVREMAPGTRSKNLVVNEANWNKDGTILGAVDSEGNISFYKPDGTPIESFQDKSSKTSQKYLSISWSPQSRYVAVGTESAQLHVWDLKSKRKSKTLAGHGVAVKSVRFWHQDNSKVASGSRDGIILIHNLATGRSSTPFKVLGEDDAIQMIEFSPLKHSQLACACDSGVVRLWDVNAPTPTSFSLAQHDAPCNALAFSPINDNFLASVGLDFKVLFHDTREKKSVRSINAGYPLTAVSFHPAGHTILVGGTNGKIAAYDIRNTEGTPVFVSEHTTGTAVNSLCYQRSGAAGSSPASSSSSSAGTMPRKAAGSTSSSARGGQGAHAAAAPGKASAEFIVSSPPRHAATAAHQPGPDALLSPINQSAAFMDESSSTGEPTALFSPIRGAATELGPVVLSPLGSPSQPTSLGLLSGDPDPFDATLSSAPALDTFSASLQSGSSRPSSLFSPPRSLSSLAVDQSISSLPNRRSTTSSAADDDAGVLSPLGGGSARISDAFEKSFRSSGALRPSMEPASFLSPAKGRTSSPMSSPLLSSRTGGAGGPSIRPSASTPVMLTPTPRSGTKTRSARSAAENNSSSIPPTMLDFSSSSNDGVMMGAPNTSNRPSLMASPIPKSPSRGGGRIRADISRGRDDSFSDFDDSRDNGSSTTAAAAGQRAPTFTNSNNYDNSSRVNAGAAGVGSTASDFPLRLMQSELNGMMMQFKEEVLQQVQNLHLDMIRQFHNQQAEIAQLLQQLSVQNQLMDEVRTLREENERLRKMY